MTGRWPFIQPRPKPGGPFRLSARGEQSPGARSFHACCKSGQEQGEACGHEEPQRAPLCVRDGMLLDVKPAIRAADQTPTLIGRPTFLARRVDALRCAFRCVRGQVWTNGAFPPSACRSSIRRSSDGTVLPAPTAYRSARSGCSAQP